MKTLTDETVWSVTMPVLSTVHIDKDTNTLLDGCAPGTCIGGVVDVYPGPQGYFLRFLPDLPGRGVDLPMCLKQMARWAYVRGTQWVRLDGDLGDTTRFLREYDW